MTTKDTTGAIMRRKGVEEALRDRTEKQREIIDQVRELVRDPRDAVNGAVWIVIHQDEDGNVRDCEILNCAPKWEPGQDLPFGWVETFREGNINGGDSVQIAQGHGKRIDEEG
jgi:hypothetical protein